MITAYTFGEKFAVGRFLQHDSVLFFMIWYESHVKPDDHYELDNDESDSVVTLKFIASTIDCRCETFHISYYANLHESITWQPVFLMNM